MPEKKAPGVHCRHGAEVLIPFGSIGESGAAVLMAQVKIRGNWGVPGVRFFGRRKPSIEGSKDQRIEESKDAKAWLAVVARAPGKVQQTENTSLTNGGVGLTIDPLAIQPRPSAAGIRALPKRGDPAPKPSSPI